MYLDIVISDGPYNRKISGSGDTLIWYRNIDHVERAYFGNTLLTLNDGYLMLGDYGYSAYLVLFKTNFEGTFTSINSQHSLYTSYQNNLNCFPNPFNPSTTISFSVNKQGLCNLSVYNIKGQLIKSLINENRPSGEHKTIWDGTDNNGNTQSSGIYFVTLKQDNQLISTKKIILLK